jgi:hypothetical protein
LNSGFVINIKVCEIPVPGKKTLPIGSTDALCSLWKCMYYRHLANMELNRIQHLLSAGILNTQLSHSSMQIKSKITLTIVCVCLHAHALYYCTGKSYTHFHTHLWFYFSIMRSITILSAAIIWSLLPTMNLLQAYQECVADKPSIKEFLCQINLKMGIVIHFLFYAFPI